MLYNNLWAKRIYTTEQSKDLTNQKLDQSKNQNQLKELFQFNLLLHKLLLTEDQETKLYQRMQMIYVTVSKLNMKQSQQVEDMNQFWLMNQKDQQPEELLNNKTDYILFDIVKQLIIFCLNFIKFYNLFIMEKNNVSLI